MALISDDIRITSMKNGFPIKIWFLLYDSYTTIHNYILLFHDSIFPFNFEVIVLKCLWNTLTWLYSTEITRTRSICLWKKYYYYYFNTPSFVPRITYFVLTKHSFYTLCLKSKGRFYFYVSNFITLFFFLYFITYIFFSHTSNVQTVALNRFRDIWFHSLTIKI